MGDVVEWTIINAHKGPPGLVIPQDTTHPFHLHTNHFQVVATSKGDGVDYDVGDWRDTITLPTPGNVTVRFRSADFDGPSLAHCHIFSHADLGMLHAHLFNLRRSRLVPPLVVTDVNKIDLGRCIGRAPASLIAVSMHVGDSSSQGPTPNRWISESTAPAATTQVQWTKPTAITRPSAATMLRTFSSRNAEASRTASRAVPPNCFLFCRDARDQRPHMQIIQLQVQQRRAPGAPDHIVDAQ